MNREAVIVINPGSTSTKVALYNRDGEILSHSVRHEQKDLEPFAKISDQLAYRLQHTREFLHTCLNENPLTVVGVVGRGGIVKPLEGGTYRVNEAFLHDASYGTYGEHASNLGSLIAFQLKDEFGLKECYTVDPVSVGNMWPKAEISGVPGIVRVGRGHPLNMKMTARKIAKLQQIPFEQTNYVVAHLGGGISISLVQGGKLVDINDALLGMGPFSPNRAGALPLRGVMKLCYTLPEQEVTKLLSSKSGLMAYLGTEDLREVLKMVEGGNQQAKLIYEAFVYQIAKEIGAYFAASKGKAQAIIITGGIAYNQKFIDDLKEFVGTLTEFHVYAGENEMEALAEGAFRVIDGIEPAKEY
ncbi:MAG TPA: butyrate kinase [Marinilabiliales bacterium]|jgi:butyrate kinase|nr:MAG: butyrate kinase [Bacteroidetes bacterium GWA2_40_14]OFX58928.1 MAG: butyrate kinase [Bacteroidetes bacterium GWC2_40_13]OFX71299.1 MAG: butyrate kinase [Bacteroidetes bacterium GWD2_40_43]OFX91506.1 MAG: butyrate kinase [Bacteroidetes bacterium GWE2_40_63]OFY19668.1 MAG: butyrate kinase [Bacteroidetes bacterium GWF2_40_13]OFZ25490.1 MAG: butyrate kinase [Bacteroidetes bacterium RIFOXYC2_FULL_40_12]HAM97617.1 butyrate kinase [Marinilabiliales bacterium]